MDSLHNNDSKQDMLNKHFKITENHLPKYFSQITQLLRKNTLNLTGF
jgi:hypothetical protein